VVKKDYVQKKILLTDEKGLIMKYKEIHIWDFPSTKIFVHLNNKFRCRLLFEIREKIGVDKALKIINQKSINYNPKKKYKYNSSHFYDWKRGFKKEKDHTDKINIPLWVLIEISKILSKSNDADNVHMKEIEKHISYYTGIGKAIPITKPKLPLLLTPEMISVIFHLCGDGHIGIGTDVSHYRQTNISGLYFFLQKLQNVFGEFRINIFENSKLVIPRVIIDFYKYYFKLEGHSWDTVRIPKDVKDMPKDFLLAGLTAFIVDEGHISDFIEVYSKNYHLIKDISMIALKLKYKISKIGKKYRYGKFDSYRFIIRPESLTNMYREIESFQKSFSLCGLGHKTGYLKQIVKIRNRKWKRRGFGITKKLIIDFLKDNKATTREISIKLNIRLSSIREHLLQLEKRNLVNRAGKESRQILWTSCKVR